MWISQRQQQAFSGINQCPGKHVLIIQSHNIISQDAWPGAGTGIQPGWPSAAHLDGMGTTEVGRAPGGTLVTETTLGHSACLPWAGPRDSMSSDTLNPLLREGRADRDSGQTAV